MLLKKLLKTLENKIYKYMASISKNAYFDILGDIVKNNTTTYYGTIKIKPVDAKSKIYIKFKKQYICNS